MWYIYIMEYYSATKMSKTVPSAKTWMDLETVIQSKSEREEQIFINALYVESRKMV